MTIRTSIWTLGFRGGAALDRFGGAADDHDAPRRRTERPKFTWVVDYGRWRREVGDQARGAVGGHPRRGQGPVLCHAGAAEISQERPQRSGGGARGGAAAGNEPAGRRLHARERRARAGDLARGAAGRGGASHPSRRRAGHGFPANAVEVRAERDGIVVEGYAGLPTHSRANSLGQYLFVNGRPVRDKLLIGVIRGAYADYLPRDRHPVVALFVTLPPREVDVNVHPAKTEVRFRDNALVRSLLMHALKEGLARDAQRAATTGGSATIAAFRPNALPRRGAFDWRRSPSRPLPPRSALAAWAAPDNAFEEAAQSVFDVGSAAATARVELSEPEPDLLDRPLGAARAYSPEVTGLICLVP